jgi:hypothetical protein
MSFIFSSASRLIQENNRASQRSDQMEDVPGANNEIDSGRNHVTPSSVDGNGGTPRPAAGQGDTPLCPSAAEPDGLVRVRQTYEPLGVSDEIIEHIAKVEGARDILLSPRCDTPDKKAMSEKLLSYATGELLGVLAAEMGTPINVITLIAKSARRIAPAAFDRWVDFQLSNGLSLGMIATVRNPTDLPRERSVEEQLAEGKLAFGSVTPVLARLVSFVGILRPKLESDLGVKTAADHLELDSALDTYLTARRIRLMAESLIAPIPEHNNVTKGLKLLEQAYAYDNTACSKIDRLRTRIQKRERKIQVGARTNVAIQVNASMAEESIREEALSA